jgi:hypothetical protein
MKYKYTRKQWLKKWNNFFGTRKNPEVIDLLALADKSKFMKIKKSDISGNYKVNIDLRKLKGSSPIIQRDLLSDALMEGQK